MMTIHSCTFHGLTLLAVMLAATGITAETIRGASNNDSDYSQWWEAGTSTPTDSRGWGWGSEVATYTPQSFTSDEADLEAEGSGRSLLLDLVIILLLGFGAARAWQYYRRQQASGDETKYEKVIQGDSELSMQNMDESSYRNEGDELEFEDDDDDDEE